MEIVATLARKQAEIVGFDLDQFRSSAISSHAVELLALVGFRV
jgi:hypothetical protein